MYNVYGFGKRIASYRKMAGLTQEELAAKLNITAQAVSKWENEISFPELTALPQIALVLNTTIEKLFGNEDNGSSNKQGGSYIPKFPESKGGNMLLVHVLGGTACYSEKQVDVTNQDSVTFKDGSSANLRQLTIVNKGPGEIVFDFIEGFPVYYCDIDMSKTELNEVYEEIDSIELTVNSADFTLTRSHDKKTYIKATGSPVFIAGLKPEKKDKTLFIKYVHDQYSNQNGNGQNKINILFGQDTGKAIKAALNGSGDININIPFQYGNFAINGSGQIYIDDMNELEAKINGSGDIGCKKIGNTKVTVNGSGDFECKEVFGSFSASVNGSGDIDMGIGELHTLELAIRGSGDVDASKITTNTANISVSGSGDVVIGRVLKETTEKHTKDSSIKVLKRG